MANGDDWAESLDWSDLEEKLYADMATDYSDMLNDEALQALYHEAFYDFDISSEHRAEIREHLYDYVEDVYDVMWDDIFDWEAWREAYEES